MQELILKYLSIHHSVSINGWGSLLMKEEAARIDFPNKQMLPPKTSIHYSVSGSEDAAFVDWLMQQLHLSSIDTYERLKKFTNQFFHQLNHEPIKWIGWGTFSKSGDRIVFNQEFNSITQPENVTSKRIIRTGAEHSIRVGNEEHTNLEMEALLHRSDPKQKHLWKIFAMLLGTIGIIFAIIFANKHQIQWKNYTNLQLLHPKDPPVLYKTP